MKFDGQQNVTSPEHLPTKSPITENHHTFLDSTTTKGDTNTTATINANSTTSSVSQEIELKNNPTSTVRTQNFSFASTYRPETNTFNNRYDNPQSLGLYPYKPIAAFTILNNEEVANALDRGKPNAIVRPIRRFDKPELARPIRHNAAVTDENTLWPPPQEHRQRNNFSSTSSKKITHLSSVSQHDHVIKRPLFITTVPTGVFLPPPKEPPIPWFLKPHIYAYSSHPVVMTSGGGIASIDGNDKAHNKDAVESTKISTSDKVFGTKSFNNTNLNLKANTHVPKKIATSANGTSLNSMRNDQSPPPSSRYSLTGGVNLTKQQFQEQIQQRRTKRDTPPQPYRNVMYDRRVIRGSVFGAQQLLENSDPFDKAAEIRRRHAIRKQKVCRNQRNVLGTPPPVNGRRHEVIQTEKYLEELLQRPPEFSVDTQTDLFLEKPPEPPYVPAKVGVDVATEIADGELFHFDAEAQPIIDILVDSCIEQSMLEVAHEQEIAALRQKQAEFLAKREAELAELRRLEAEELRLQAEKERRLQQDSIAKELDEEMQKSVTAAKLLQGHIAGLLPEVLDNLEPATDAAKKEHLMKTIAPWLTVEVAEEVGHIVDSREILTVIIQEIIKQRATAYAGYKEDMPLETVITG
uniref:Radial spoke head protein 3-B n=1 Tax=Ceratitis capitata TaxID=7213 RepID=W8B6Q7_CERCA